MTDQQKSPLLATKDLRVFALSVASTAACGPPAPKAHFECGWSTRPTESEEPDKYHLVI